MPKKTLKQKHKFNRLLQWGLLFAFFSIAVFLVQKNATEFQASVIPTNIASPYDGTALPIVKSPKWTSLTQDQYKLNYDSIPADKMQSLPTYDPAILKTPTESLGWKSVSDLNIRNSKITFTTPYMGDYKLDGLEYAGSHLAIDIKVPVGTPVDAIGNGVVVKVADQAGGFGKHIVIRHDNFPSLNDKSVKVTLYSSYSHLSQSLVAEGDIVTKGQLIAKSGQSGFATTPHVHFQIDNDQAPWHPYWPFTYQDSEAAGLDFTGAINAGLGQDKAVKTTVNPMLYVQKYLSDSVGNSNIASLPPPAPVSVPVAPAPVVPAPIALTPIALTPSPVSDLPPLSSVDTAAITPTPLAPVLEPVTPPAPEVVPATAFTLTHQGDFVKNADVTFTLTAINANGNVAKSYKPKEAVYFQVIGGSADVPNYLKPEDFTDGVAEFSVKPTSDLGLQIKASDNEISGESDVVLSAMFTDVVATAPYFNALGFLKEHSVIGGYPDGSFKPDVVVSRVEALKFILKGANLSLLNVNKLPFNDASVAEWYADYVATAYDKNIVDGYPDLSFKPAKTVNKVEFLKMLLLATNTKVNPFVTRDVYKDVPKDAWFAAYVKTAKNLNIIDVHGSSFNPEDGMTRREVAETIYRMILLKASGAEAYSANMAVAPDKVSQYFS